MAGAVHERNVPLQPPRLAVLLENVRGRGALGPVVPRHALLRRIAFIDLSVGIPE